MLTREKYQEVFKERLDSMLTIMKAKNADYASDWDPFKNFRLVESAGVSTLEEWILIRMFDKMSRISNLLDTEAQVKDESVIDTLVDLANYSIILSIFLEEKNKSK